MAKRKTHQEFVEELAKMNPNIEVLGEYKGARKPILVRCKIDGCEWTPQAGQLVCGRRRGCPKCGRKSISDKQRFSFEYVKEYVESFGYKLLSTEYNNSDEYLILECPNGHIWDTITFNHFKNRNNRCYHCEYEYNRKGENNHHWNPNLTDEEREHKRSELGNNWRMSVYKKDDYTCQCCGKRGGVLNAHHLDGYDWCIERRTDISNGITLCKECHKKFHKEYGYGGNTEEQFQEWINKLKDIDNN